MSDSKKVPEGYEKWIEPNSWIYEATDLQVTFRRFVREQVDDGILMKKQWFKNSRRDGRFNDGVKLSDWNRWSSEPRFVAWFYEDFPEAAPMSKEEFALVDSLWTDGVVKGMQNDKDWAYKLYANVRFKGEQRVQDREETRELRSYLNDTSGSKWRTPAAEA
jgi:hypothetical protein